MYHKKYHLNRVYLILLWLLLYFLRVSVTLMFVMMIFTIMPMGIFVKTQPISNETTIIFIGIFLLFIIVQTIWRKATFTKKDFVELMKSFNFKKIKRPFYHPFWISLSDPHRYSEGFVDGIYVVARIDMPSIAYSPTKRISADNPDQSSDKSKKGNSMRVNSTGEYMEEESRIELFSLINGTFNIDVKIKIENDEREIPTTDCPEIDTILRASLNDAKHFYARLIFDKTCLRMTIIGGSWQGEKFRQKILKGFEIFQAINNALKKKYSVGNWDLWDVKWDKKGNFFYLAPKEGQ